jgi:hypothetical protein
MTNRTQALQAVSLMLSVFHDSKADRELFTKLAATGLEDFSVASLKAMCDPKVGLIATSKYMPSIAEMRQFCKTFVDPTFVLLPKKVEQPIVMTEEERQWMLDKFQKLSYSLGSANERNDK